MSVADVNHPDWGLLATQLTSADEVKESSGAGEPWQVVLSLDSRVHLQPVSGGSPVGAWWFLTSGQADVQRTWIKHMAHLTTDWRLCKVSNEIWAVISMRQKKGGGWGWGSFLSDVCDAALNMYDICVAWPEWLSRILLWLWQSKRRQVCQRISAVNEVESEWAAHYQPGISTKTLCDRWQPSVYPPTEKHHVCQVAVRYTALATFLAPSALSEIERLFFSFLRWREGNVNK